MKFTAQEIAAILVGLRMLQREIEEKGPEAAVEGWPHFMWAECDAPTTEEIDLLCESFQ